LSDLSGTTQEISFASLPSEMVSAIHKHIQQYNLGAIVTPRWLVWAMTGTRTETAILSAQLINVTV